MMKKLILITALVLLASCAQERPSAPDGGSVITVMLVDTTGALPGSVPGEPAVLPGAMVSLQARSHEYTDVSESDDAGVADFAGLVAGDYTIFARREIFFGAQQKTVFSGFTDVHVEGQGIVEDTMYVSTVTVNGLLINEIYYCGCDYSKFYFYDQFAELYNASTDTLYLDGCVLTRSSSSMGPDPEALDHARASYAFQFPGTPVTGRQYPIFPGQYIVIAADAIDHSLYATRGADLSNADWECLNVLGSDYDVPGIPNLVSIHPESRVDFLISLTHDVILLTTGEGVTVMEVDGAVRLAFPLDSVLDGVEYATSADRTKYIPMCFDAGFAGLGCVKYSGQSTERREVGIDANNSTFDFILLDGPTIGYSHAE